MPLEDLHSLAIRLPTLGILADVENLRVDRLVECFLAVATWTQEITLSLAKWRLKVSDVSLKFMRLPHSLHHVHVE